MPRKSIYGQGYRALIIPGVFVLLASTLAALINLYGVFKKAEWDAKGMPAAPASTGILVPQEIPSHVKTHSSPRQRPVLPEFLRLTVMDPDNNPLRGVSFLLEEIRGASNDSGEITIPISRLHAQCAKAMFRIYLSKPGYASADYYVGLHDNGPIILKTK